MITSNLKETTINLSDITDTQLEVLNKGQSSDELQNGNSANLDILDDIFLADSTIKDRKIKIMNHLKQSSNNFQYSSANRQKRNSTIRDHIRQSLSQ